VAQRVPFDIKKPLVAAREFTFAGDLYKKGDPFPRLGKAGDFNQRLIRRQYEAAAVNHAAEADPADAPVQMTGPQGGRYTITAPWLEQPEIVRGKANADARFAELTEQGAPLGFIEGGSAVTVEGGDGGWYVVDAPWLNEPEKLRGREAAEARQRELHEAGEPDSHSGVALTAGENGWFTITRTDLEGELKVQGAEAAYAAATALRNGETVEGEPAEWAVDAETDSGAGKASGTAGEAGQEGESAPGAETPAGGAKTDDKPAGGETLTVGKTETDGDPHKGAAEKIEGTGPAKAADDVEAAAGGATGEEGGGGEPASE
jgi:hypothetical protein